MTYSYRTIDCPDCWEGQYEIASGPGYVSRRCDECDGTGEIDATCKECGKHEPLNADGLCEKCRDAVELSLKDFVAKWHPKLTIDFRKVA